MSQEEIEKTGGQIVFALHPKKRVIYVYHTKMFEQGFADRNSLAKGFGNLLEICRRETTANDNCYFLGWTRAKWEVYGSVENLIADEMNFCPSSASLIKENVLAFLKRLNIKLSNTLQTELL